MNEMRPVLEAPGRASLHPATGAAARFSRHRYELPLLSVFLCLALLELVTVHLLLAMWSMTAAWTLTALSLLAVAQIGWLIRGLVEHPTEVDGSAVHVRYGAAGRLTVPLDSIVRVANVAFAPEQKGPDVFRATVIASPNLALHLAAPISVRRRQVSTLALRLDDPAAFMARLASRETALPAVLSARRERALRPGG